MEKNKKTRRVGTVVSIVGIAVFTVMISLVMIGAFLINGIDTGVEGIVEMARNNSIPSKLYTLGDNGEYVEYACESLGDGTNREYAEIEKIPRDLVEAFIAIEDKRFLKHSGVDVITSAKAVITYIFGSGRSAGGSTITQQLIKNLTGDDSYSVKRKITEMIRAIRLERVMSKREIMEAYLNNIYLSQNTYGVAAAARLYFNKDVSELTLSECASIAAITRAPTVYDPIKNPENNKERRNIILSEMYDQGYISKDEYRAASDDDITLDINKDYIGKQVSGWYTDAVIERASEIIASYYSVEKNEAVNMMYRSGFSIITAMDEDVQGVLEKYYEERPFGDVQSAFCVVDPYSGYVLGLVGGCGKKEGSRILCRASECLRSPGSSVKPLSVYAPALEEGIINYSSVFDDIPTKLTGESSSDMWPKNADGLYRGLTSLEGAVKRSSNTVAVRVLGKLGLEKSYSTLKSLGISSLVTNERIDGKVYTDLSSSALALGGMTHGVSLLSLTSAYGIFPSEGLYTEPTLVLRIYDRNGNIIYDAAPARRRIISPENAQIMNKLLESVVSEGTAAGYINTLTRYASVGGKTGTTSSNHDRWFIGYTTDLVGGIWIGYDEQKSLSSTPYGAHITLFDKIMTEITLKKEYEKRDFADNALVEVYICRDSGALVTDACMSDERGSRRMLAYFTSKDIPTETCSVHTFVRYCREGGGIAGDSCPDECCEYVGMLVHKRELPYNIYVEDAQYLYKFLSRREDVTVNRWLPFYWKTVEEGKYPGKSRGEYPFNRFCTSHTEAEP